MQLARVRGGADVSATGIVRGSSAAGMPRGSATATDVSALPRPRGSAAWSAATVGRMHGYAIDAREAVYSVGTSRREALSLWVSFKSLCALSQSPLGVDRSSFASGVQFLRFEDDAFVQRAFELLDATGSNAVAWRDFSSALEKLESGSMENRADFLVDLYDKEGTNLGFSRDNLHYFFRSSFFVKGEMSDMEIPGTEVEAGSGGRGGQLGDSGFMSAPLSTPNDGDAQIITVDARTLFERIGSEPGAALAALVRAFSDETFDAILEGAASGLDPAEPPPSTVTKAMLCAYVKSREDADKSENPKPLDVAAILGRCLVTGNASNIEHIVINSTAPYRLKHSI